MHKDQGNIGEAAAILWFTQNGFKVSKPVFENTPYDLIVDSDQLYRVQVKSTSSKRADTYQVELRTKGGNSSWNGVVKVPTMENSDLLFVYCEDGDKYLIPVSVFSGQGRIALGAKYEDYRLV